jgi:polysaccharide pyruvyl transferase WcaK-like protein
LPARIPIWWRDALSAASYATATGREIRVGAEIAFLVEPRAEASCAALDWTRARRREGRRNLALVPNPMVGTPDPLGAPQRDPAPYVSMLARLCALGGGTRVIVLPNDARAIVGDLELTSAIAAALPVGLRDDVYFSATPVPAPRLAELFRHVDVLVGARFHALVMALVAGAPIVALEYQDKMRGVLRACGLEDYWIPCEGGLDPARIVARVDDVLTRASAVRAAIAAAVPEQRRRARAMLADVLAGGRSA